MTEFMNLPSSVPGRRSNSGKLFQIRQRGNSGHQNGYGSSGRCMCIRRPNADGGKACQRKPRCNSQEGKTVPSHATTHKLAMTPNQQPMEVPQNWSDVIPSPCTRDQGAAAFCTDCSHQNNESVIPCSSELQ